MEQLSTYDIIYVFDLVGTFVFAVSGWLLASKKQLDAFGASVIAFITAIGGGTLRDVLIGNTPVGWMQDLNVLIAISAGIIMGSLFKRVFERLRTTLFLFDSIGIGLFTVIGLEKTLGFGLNPIVALIMGVTSAVFGGVLRDTLVNEIPLIFRREIYASACIGGGVLFLGLKYLEVNLEWSIILTVVCITLVRILAVTQNWSLRSIR